MNKLIALCAIVLMVPVLLAPVGCQSGESGVMEHIMIFKSEPGDPPPPSGWSLRPPNPYPEDIRGVFSPGDKMFLGLSLSSDISGEITFSKYTFLNQETGVEEQVELADDLGPFEPGRTFLVGFEDPWPVPDEPGEYQVRIYLGDEIVASAFFNVGVWPDSWGPEMEYSLAPIHEVRVFFEGEQAWAYVKGGLPDSCSEYSGADFHYQNVDANKTISIEVTIKRPKETICEQVYGYFEKYYAIGGDQYISGETYTIQVNDYTTTFVGS